MTQPVVLSLAIALIVGLVARNAGAECSVVPGPQGEIATWVAAGAWPVPQTRPLRTVADQLATAIGRSNPGTLRPRAGDLVAGTANRWLAFASPGARFEPDSALRGRGPRTVLVGADLVAAEAGEFQLFLGSDDGLAVFLDGREIYRRAAVRDARDDDDRVLLTLTPGRHALVMRQYVNGGLTRISARLLDAGFRPTVAVRVVLPGVDDASCADLARAATRFEVRREVVPAGTRVRIDAEFPGGTARRDGETSRPMQLVLPGGGAPVSAEVRLDASAMATTQIEATAIPGAASARVELAVGSGGPATREIDLEIPVQARQSLLRAARLLPPLSETAPPAWLPAPSLASVKYVAQRLAGLVAGGDSDRAHIAAEGAIVGSLLDGIEAAQDPYASRRGPLRRGYRSDIDGSLQGYSVYVPPGYRGDRPYPLIVALHGLGGTAHRMLAVIFGIYDEQEARTHADRFLPTLPDANAIIVAPFAFGDSGFRGPGEADVMRVIDEVRAAYRIDPDRTYMTGLSMGGIGAAAIPLHHPDVFAATAPLCGYHSYFVRNDTRGVRRPWELFLMEARSNASWAENGMHLPMYLVHGTRDRPTANSQVLVDRYTELHYAMEAEWPDLGHNVWSQTYAEGRIVPRFLRFRRTPAPRRVRFRTAGMQWRTSYWVDIDALVGAPLWGEVDATIERDSVRATTRGVTALTLSPPASLFAADPARAGTGLELRLDGDRLAITPGQVNAYARVGGHWIAASSRVIARPLGPVRDVFRGPIAVVYGTHDPAEREMDLRVARAWARRPGVHAEIQLIADDDVTPELTRSHALVLVGSARANAYLARIESRLPIRVEGNAVVAGTVRFESAEIGTTFVTQNPESPEQPLLVITGANALGIWRSRFLPDLVPDFIVYDAALAPARGRITLGQWASVRAAGFFAPNGALPAEMRDPFAAAPPAADGASERNEGDGVGL